jgi:hypothetical protein
MMRSAPHTSNANRSDSSKCFSDSVHAKATDLGGRRAERKEQIAMGLFGVLSQYTLDDCDIFGEDNLVKKALKINVIFRETAGAQTELLIP